MKRSIMAVALLSALGSLSGVVQQAQPSQAGQGVNAERLNAGAGGASVDRATPRAPRVSFGSAVRAVGFGAAQPFRHSYRSGRAVSVAEQKRRSKRASNQRRHKATCGMRGRSNRA